MTASERWDAIVIGSGFGGAMAAHALVNAGKRVLMLERGGWVARGPESWANAGLATPSYSMESPYDVETDAKRYRAGAWHCVGGQSVFYGGASYRFRVSDFRHHDGVVGDSGAEWPFRYADLEPFYGIAERLLAVSGDATGDHTAPWRSAPYPQRPAPLAASARRIADAGRRLGLSPSRIPLAISYTGDERHHGCIECGTCDGFACAAEAKNDLSTAVIPALIRQGMTLRANVACVGFARRGARITGVWCVNRVTGTRELLEADDIVLAAGALATPHLLLAAGLDALNPAGAAVGRYLTRHRNAVVMGMFPSAPNRSGAFDKQVAFFDDYHAAGCIQSLTPPAALVRAYLPWPLRAPAAMLLSRGSGLLAIAEDQPRSENRVSIDRRSADRFGLPRLHVTHRYSRRDEAAVALLVARARRVLREAGALCTIVRRIETFSHALGTVRMGRDARASPLDASGRFRGLDNLYVTDGSALPRSAGVNPSLTIAANALRIGAIIAGERVLRRAERALPVWHDAPASDSLTQPTPATLARP